MWKTPLTGVRERGNIIKLSQTAGENRMRQPGEKILWKKLKKALDNITRMW